MTTVIRKMIIYVVGGPAEKGHKGTFWGNGKVHYLDWSIRWLHSVNICQTLKP